MTKENIIKELYNYLEDNINNHRVYINNNDIITETDNKFNKGIFDYLEHISNEFLKNNKYDNKYKTYLEHYPYKIVLTLNNIKEINNIIIEYDRYKRYYIKIKNEYNMIEYIFEVNKNYITIKNIINKKDTKKLADINKEYNNIIIEYIKDNYKKVNDIYDLMTNIMKE